jgi:hypothetical protein
MKLHKIRNGQRRLRIWLFLMGAAGLLCGGACSAGTTEGTAGTAIKSASAAAPGTNAAAIPLGEVAAQAEAAFASLHSIEGNLSADQATATILQELPVLTRETSARQEESSRMLSSSPSLEMLRRLGSEWQGFRNELAEWKRSLTKRVTQLDEDQGRLARMEEIWEATRSTGPGSKMPPEVLEQVARVIAAVKGTREKAEAQQMVALTLQTRVSEQDGRALHELNAIELAREAFIRRLLVRDSPPIWSAELWSDSAQNLALQGSHSFALQVQALSGYVERKGSRFILQAILFLAIFFSLVGAGRRVRRLGGEEAGQAALIFHSPFATALVLSLLASGWIYPQMPRLLSAIVGAAALIPTTLVVRGLIDRRLFPVLNALVAFYFIDQLCMIAASQAILSRVLLLGEMLGGALFFGWLLGPAGFGTALDSNRLWKAVGLGCRVALGSVNK